MFRIVLDERKKREIDPTLELLRECAAEAGKTGAADAYTRDRLAALLEFFETMSGWYGQMRRLSIKAIVKFVRMGDKVLKVMGVGVEQ